MDLRSRMCIVWDTKMPVPGRSEESPPFKIKNCESRLKMYATSEKSSGEVFICVLKKDRRRTSGCSYEVLIYLEDKKNITRGPILCCTKYVYRSDIEPTIWSKSRVTMLKEIPHLKEYPELTIVCEIEFEDDVQILEHKSVQTAADSSFYLEGLSQDFAKLQSESRSSDVQLKVGNRTFPAHRAILAARSEVFKAMFCNQMKENMDGIVCIEDIDPVVMNMLLTYLYSGKFIDNLSFDAVCNLYTVADKYAVHDLMKACSDFMASNITNANFTEILLLADFCSDKKLKEKVVSFLNREGLIMSDSWRCFSKEYPRLSNEVYQEIITKCLTVPIL